MTIDEIKQFFANDKYAELSGVVIEHVEAGKATGYMDVTERHLNAGGACQGGAIFTLADTLIAVAVNSTGIGNVSVQASISFTAAGRPGSRLTCKAEVSVPHKKLPSVIATVTDNDGRIVATATALCYNKAADKK